MKLLFLLMMCFVSSVCFAHTGIYLEIKVEGDDRKSLSFGDFELVGKTFLFNGKPACILNEKSAEITPSCPFYIDYFLSDDQKSIFVKIDSIDYSGYYQVKVNDKAHELTWFFCSDSENTKNDNECSFHYFEPDKKINKVIDYDNRLLVSYLLVKDKASLSLLPEIPINASMLLPMEYLDDGGSVYYQLKGPVLNIQSSYDDNWNPSYYKKNDFKEITKIDKTARLWNRTRENGNSRSLHLDISFQNVDNHLNWIEVIATPNVYLDIRDCKKGRLNCFFTHYEETIHEERVRNLEIVQKYKLSPFMDKFIEELLPCLDSKDLDCIKDFFVTKEDLKDLGDEEGCYDQSFSLPNYNFVASDIDELKECLKYENLRPDLLSASGKNRVCAFVPRQYLKKNKFKLIGLIPPSSIKVSYDNYVHEQIYPYHSKGRLNHSTGDGLSYFGILDKISSETIAEKIKYLDAQWELAARSSLLLDNLKNENYLFSGVAQKLAKTNYKFWDIFPQLAKRDDVRPIFFQFDDFYKKNIQSFFKQKRIHSDFFYEQSFADNYFRFRCAQEDLDIRHLDSDDKIISLKEIFIDGIKKLNKNINTQCVPLSIRVHPEFLSKIKDHSEWFHLFIPSKFYTSSYFKRKYKTRSFYNKDDFKEPLGLIKFATAEKDIVTSKDFQEKVFREMPWVIKYFEDDFIFSEEALLNGLSIHYNPQRFFTENQLAQTVVKSFLKNKKFLSKGDYEKSLLGINLNVMSKDVFFELMDPYLYTNDDFHVKRGNAADLNRKSFSDRVDTRYLVVLGEITELTPGLRNKVLENCRKGGDRTHLSRFLYLPWSNKFPEFITTLNECLHSSRAKYGR